MNASQKHLQWNRRQLGALMLASTLAGAGSLARAEGKISFKLPDSETTVNLGGYVKLDAIWSDRSAGVDSSGDQQLNINLVPVGPSAGQHKTDQVTFHARQTRLNFGTSTPTSYGGLTTYIEGDFFGADGNETSTNSNGFRVRHAYGTLGGLLAGQTWTNFFNEQAYAETLDFGGPVGEVFVRQAQLRWTQGLASGDWSVSAENPESLVATKGSATPFRSDSDHAPDFTARVRYRASGATYSGGLLVRNIHVDAAAPAANSGKWGEALAFTGIIPVGKGDDLRFDANVGNAIGRYQVGGFFPDGYLDAAGRMHLASQRSGFIAYRHFWAPGLRSTFEFSAADSNPPGDTTRGINRSDRSQHLNLIWSPVPAVNLGAELIHAQRTVVGGDRGSLNRVQLSAQYSF
jgi:hypothetical protein